MKKGVFSCVCVLFLSVTSFLPLTINETQPETFFIHKKRLSQLQYTFFEVYSSNKALAYLWCFCDDGSVYSYGNTCKIGWQGCEPNPCPQAPQGCSTTPGDDGNH